MKTLFSKKHSLLYLFLSAVLITPGCGEEDPIEPPVVVDYLCDGNGDNSYWPLQEGNKWTYDAGGSNWVLTVTGTADFAGTTYSKITVNESGMISYRYLRNDAAGNTYEYSDFYSEEHRIIAANPVTGQVVDDQPPGGNFRDLVVDHYGAPLFDVYECDYPNVLYIQEFDNTTGDYFDVDDYVQGVGPVSYGTGLFTFLLVSVTLN